MANKVPVKANYTNGNVTSLGEFVSGDTFDVSYIADGTITAAKLAADTATQAELDTVSGVASAALPLAGGAMTGGITSSSDITVGNAYISNNYSSFPGLRVPNNAYIGCAAATTMIQFQGSGVTHIPGATTMGGDLTITQTVADSAAIDYLVDIAGNRTSNAVAGQGVGLRFKIPSWKDSTESYVGAGIGAVRESSTDSDVSTALTFSTSQNDATLDEFMRITSTGKVGIGTSSPSSLNDHILAL